MTMKFLSLGLLLALAGHAALPGVQAVDYLTTVGALQARPEFSATWSVVKFLGLQNDKTFAWKQFQTTFYVPSNQAWSKFAAQKGKASLQAWLKSAPRAEIEGVLLQHIVPAYNLGNTKDLYDGQIQPTMLTFRNYRSKLTVTVGAGGRVKLTAEGSSANIASASNVDGGDNRLWLIDGVLVPDLKSPAKKFPTFGPDATLLSAIATIPGLEDLYAAVSKNAALKKLLSDNSKPVTFLAPNNFAQNELKRATGKPAAELLFNNPTWLTNNVKHQLLPANGVLTSDEIIALKGKFIRTALPNHPLRVVSYPGHIQLKGEVDHGKLVRIVPRHPAILNPTTPKGLDFNLQVGKHMLHIMDAWPLASK